MKLIVGLGNPGRKYQETRHNVGFRVIGELHKRFGQPRPTAKFDSELVQVLSGDHKVLLQSPLTFMNLSGKAVRAAADFYKICRDDILVVCDDLNLDLGRLRFRPQGSAGGQNGLKDIIQKMGSQEFARLRVGVSKPPEAWDSADFVLSKFRPDELVALEATVRRAADGVITWIKYGTQESMNRYNAELNQKKPTKKKSPPSTKDAAKDNSVEEKGESTPDDSNPDESCPA